jgi:ribosomal protein L16/L10AE
MKPETGSRFYDGKHPGKPVWLVMNIAQMKKLKEIIDSSDNTN